jgi:hypothetical protein
LVQCTQSAYSLSGSSGSLSYRSLVKLRFKLPAKADERKDRIRKCIMNGVAK